MDREMSSADTSTLLAALVPQNVDRVCTLYQTFPESCVSEVEAPRNPYLREANGQPACPGQGPLSQPPYPGHMPISQRLCKVIQELVDTEKSYVKVRR